MHTYKYILTVFFIIAATYISNGQDMVKAAEQQGLEKTIRYDVSTFTDTRDRKLEDVMKKMPGLASDFGSYFTYNGMFVEKYYVNGQDILGDNTSAVLNMKPEDVEYVEIIENHVTQKVMKGIQYSINAAINIILKESAHTGWTGAVKAGGGFSPALYNLDFNAINLGTTMTNSILLKADDTGLNLSGDSEFSDFSFWGLPQFLNISPSLAPLSDQRVRFNNSLLGNIGSNISLSDDLSLNIQLSYDTDRITATSLDETTYYLDQGESVIDEIGENAVSAKKKLGATIILLSNTEKSFFQNKTDFKATWQDVDKLITGSFPSDQRVNTTPLVLTNEMEYKFPLGNNILSIDSEVNLRTRPEHITIDRDWAVFSQNIDSRSADVDLYATYNMNFGKFTASLKAGGSGYSRSISTEMTGAGEIADTQNKSTLNILRFVTNASLTYISNKLQLEANIPLTLGHYNLIDRVGDDNMEDTKLYFAPSVSAKYQATNNLSFTGMVASNQEEVSHIMLYPGLVFNDFRTASRGIPRIKGDRGMSIEGGVAYRKPERSLFISGSIGRVWSRPAFINMMDFSSNYIISGYDIAPKGYKDVSTMINADISKGIGVLKGKIGIGAFGMASTSSMIRNGVDIPYYFKSIGFTPNINGRVFPWLNVIYSIDINWNVVKMEGDDTSSSSKGYTQNMELIFSPWSKFNFSLLGEHYYTEFTDDVVKHLILTDFKAEYSITPNWILMASVTNILNQDTYNYTLVNSMDFSKSYTSYNIRPRNVLLSLYHKF